MKRIALFILLGYSLQLAAQNEQKLSDRVVKLINSEKYKEALPLVEELIASMPEDFSARYNRAVIFFHLKRYQESLDDYLFLCEEDPTNSEYFFQAGNLYEQLDSLKKADYYYTEALKIHNTTHLYWFKRGTCYLKLQWYDKAIFDFNQSIRLNEAHHNTLHNRALAYFRKGEISLACNDWCQALLLGNPHSASHLQQHCKKIPDECLLTK